MLAVDVSCGRLDWLRRKLSAGLATRHPSSGAGVSVALVVRSVSAGVTSQPGGVTPEFVSGRLEKHRLLRSDKAADRPYGQLAKFICS